MRKRIGLGVGRCIQWHRGLIPDMATVLLIGGSILALGLTSPAVAQVVPDPTVAAISPELLLLEYLKQGGVISVLLVVLFFYRRDWKMLNEGAQQELIDLVRDNTKAMAVLEGAVRESSVVAHRVTRLVEVVISEGRYGRRVLDTDPPAPGPSLSKDP